MVPRSVVSPARSAPQEISLGVFAPGRPIPRLVSARTRSADRGALEVQRASPCTGATAPSTTKTQRIARSARWPDACNTPRHEATSVTLTEVRVFLQARANLG